jgi:RimJ/RimL family protein N-acetyltransferase
MLSLDMGQRADQQADFDLQPILTGDLLELRPLKPEDFEQLFAAASDPLIWTQHPESDRYVRDVFQRYFDGAIESRGAFAIIDRRSGRIIGSSRYHDFKPVEREVEIGWTFLERAFWGGAYNNELKCLMLGHAFKGVDRVLFIVGEDNVRSRRAVEKIGGKFVRKTQRPDRHGGSTANVVYVIEKSAWQNVRLGLSALH